MLLEQILAELSNEPELLESPVVVPFLWEESPGHPKTNVDEPVISLEKHGLFHNRLLVKERAIEPAGEEGDLCFGTPSSIPFQWEAEPGKPKVSSTDDKPIVSLSPPPMLQVNLASRSVNGSTVSVSSSATPSPRTLSLKVKSILQRRFPGTPRSMRRPDNASEGIFPTQDTIQDRVTRCLNVTSRRDKSPELNPRRSWDLSSTTSSVKSSITGPERSSELWFKGFDTTSEGRSSELNFRGSYELGLRSSELSGRVLESGLRRHEIDIRSSELRFGSFATSGRTSNHFSGSSHDVAPATKLDRSPPTIDPILRSEESNLEAGVSGDDSNQAQDYIKAEARSPISVFDSPVSPKRPLVPSSHSSSGPALLANCLLSVIALSDAVPAELAGASTSSQPHKHALKALAMLEEKRLVSQKKKKKNEEVARSSAARKSNFSCLSRSTSGVHAKNLTGAEMLSLEFQKTGATLEAEQRVDHSEMERQSPNLCTCNSISRLVSMPSMMKRVRHRARRGEGCNGMGLYACYYGKKEPESLSSEVVIESKRLCPPASLEEHHSSITGEDLQVVVDNGSMERAPEDQQDPIHEDEEKVHSSQYPIGSTFVFDSSSCSPAREAPGVDRADEISTNNGSRRLLEAGSLNSSARLLQESHPWLESHSSRKLSSANGDDLGGAPAAAIIAELKLPKAGDGDIEKGSIIGGDEPSRRWSALVMSRLVRKERRDCC